VTDIDPNTGRPYGDHGTANDAIEYALDVLDFIDGPMEFLNDWREGAAFEEWPEFYRWLANKKGFGRD
jgi:hypothetical protein